MDKYQQDYKFVYGEKAPAYRKKTMPNNKADYTVLNLLDEINECDNIKKYQELLKEKNNFPKAMIKSLSHEFTGIYFADGSSITQEITTISLSIPQIIIKNTPEDNFNARKQLVEAGYSLFNIPSVEDVQENGFDWLHEEITHFKALLNPNFIEQEKQIDQKPELKENEYEEEYDAFIEQMDANGGMSSMAAEADYNAFYEEQEDVDEVQHQMDIDNGLIDENGNEILYDVPEEKQEELSDEEFDSYIHSEGFISKFGDWEKANRLEKLKKSEPLIGSDSIIVEGVDVSDIASRLRASYSIENLKQLQNIARDAGREVIAKLRNEQNIKSPKPPIVINTDSGKEFKVQMLSLIHI